MIHRTAREREAAISLTPFYHFHPLHKQLDISPEITAGTYSLHIASTWTRNRLSLVSDHKLLTTKLFALKRKIAIYTENRNWFYREAVTTGFK